MALTQADSITGTPHYLSPEGLTQLDAVDARSDLYALGAVGYFFDLARRADPKSSAP